MHHNRVASIVFFGAATFHAARVVWEPWNWNRSTPGSGAMASARLEPGPEQPRPVRGGTDVGRTVRALAFCMTFASPACGGGVGPDDPSGWVGTISEEGSVTTVRNTSGSVWGGTAALVPEATIGVPEGADEYMFGRISSIAANGGEILIVDRDARVIRAYDYTGRYLHDIGRSGQGPGEYGFAHSVGYDPEGRILAVDFGGRRMLVFGPSGEYDGRVWVRRAGPGRLLPGCNPDAETWQEYRAGMCWADTARVDVFDTDGRYLGEVAFPPEVIFSSVRPWIDGNTVIANVEDEEGTVKVVRYRLELPRRID